MLVRAITLGGGGTVVRKTGIASTNNETFVLPFTPSRIDIHAKFNRPGNQKRWLYTYDSNMLTNQGYQIYDGTLYTLNFGAGNGVYSINDTTVILALTAGTDYDVVFIE